MGQWAETSGGGGGGGTHNIFGYPISDQNIRDFPCPISDLTLIVSSRCDPLVSRPARHRREIAGQGSVAQERQAGGGWGKSRGKKYVSLPVF